MKFIEIDSRGHKEVYFDPDQFIDPQDLATCQQCHQCNFDDMRLCPKLNLNSFIQGEVVIAKTQMLEDGTNKVLADIDDRLFVDGITPKHYVYVRNHYGLTWCVGTQQQAKEVIEHAEVIIR